MLPTRVDPPETSIDDLSPQEDQFAILYYAAENDRIRQNATRSYAQAYWSEGLEVEPGTNRYRSASTAGSRLLQRPRVRARIEELRDAAADRAKAVAAKWWEDVPQARETLRDAMRGDLKGPKGKPMTDQEMRSAVEAAKEVVARAYGSVKLQHEHQVSGQAIVAITAGPQQSEPEPANGGEPEGREIPGGGPRIEPADGA